VRLFLRFSLVAGLLAAGIAAPPPPDAFGAAPPPPVEVTYRSRAEWVPGRTVGETLGASCARGTVVAGGGSSITGISTGAALIGSHPVDHDDRDNIPDDGWRSVANNLSNYRQRLTTWVVCARNATFTYRSVTDDVPPQTRATHDSSCSSAESVTAGGFLMRRAGRSLTLEGSHPSDNAFDADATPDNAWRVRVSNQSSGKRTLRTWAVCARSLTLSFTANPRLISPNTISRIATPCASGWKTLGGGAIAQQDLPFALAESVPFEAIVDDGTYNAWIVTVWNPGASSQNVNVTSICLSP
jgi:hypothetical protein